MTHGRAGGKDPTYRTWNGMLQRCENPHNAKFAAYGGAGVAVCEEWHRFDAFFSDMGERPPGHTIDRIDGTKGYSPRNCRWATIGEQQRNLRSNVSVTISGETMLLCEWAERLGISDSALRYRIRRGWPDEKILGVKAKLGNRVVRAACSTLTALGKTMTYAEWGDATGLKPNTIRERIRCGHLPDDAVTMTLVKRRADERKLCETP